MEVIKSELISIRDTLVKQMEKDAQDASELKGKIDAFKTTITSVANFEGAIFQKISTKLDNYNAAIDMRNNISTELSSKISATITAIITAMGSDEKIDTSKKEELNKTLKEYNDSIDRLNNDLMSYRAKYSETNLGEYRDQIGGINRSLSYYRNAAEVIKKDIEKIEKIESTDASQLSQLTSLDSALLTYSAKTKEIESQRSNITVPVPGTLL